MTDRRTIIVTGCSSGIGAYCASVLHRDGWRVFATVRRAEDGEALEAQGIEAFLMDYTEADTISALVRDVTERSGGRIDALFNNGAYGQPGAVEDLPTDALRAQFETNVFGWHELTRQVIPFMRRRGEGRIVQCSSILGLVPYRYRGAYTASKFALEGLSVTLRMELEGSGIHVSLIEPGPIASRFTATALKHIEFIQLEPGKALTVLVSHGGDVENRVIDLPAGITVSQLHEASNFLNAHIRGRTLGEARADIARLQEETRAALDTLSQELVEKGLAVWAGTESDLPARLIVRGRANLLENVTAQADIELLRHLFEDMETQDGLIQLLDLAEAGSGVRIFIGSENKLFSLSGSSLVVAPYRDKDARVVGALGVIGPTRLNYARVVPMVDYTAQLISRMLR